MLVLYNWKFKFAHWCQPGRITTVKVKVTATFRHHDGFNYSAYLTLIKLIISSKTTFNLFWTVSHQILGCDFWGFLKLTLIFGILVSDTMSFKTHEERRGSERKYSSLTEQYIHVTLVVAAYWYVVIQVLNNTFTPLKGKGCLLWSDSLFAGLSPSLQYLWTSRFWALNRISMAHSLSLGSSASSPSFSSLSSK